MCCEIDDPKYVTPLPLPMWCAVVLAADVAGCEHVAEK